MEDSSFIWRSMYAVHLRGWLQLFPARQVGVVDPTLLLAPEPLTAGGDAGNGGGRMHRLLGFPGLPVEARDTQTQQHDLHENSRKPVIPRADVPKDVLQGITSWLRPHNCRLGGLLARHGLGGSNLADVPWLAAELREAQDEGGQDATRCRTLTGLERFDEGG